MLYAGPITDADALCPPEIAVDYGTVRHVLRQYEGWRARARAIAGMVVFAPFVATPPALLALSVWVAHGGIEAFGVGLVSLATTSLPGWAHGRRLWERPVRSRLASRTAYEPRVAQVLVNVADEDLEAARLVIRRAGLIDVYSRTRGDVDALPLNVTIAVARPSSLPRIDDYAARDAVCEIFRATKIPANVGEVEINTRSRKPG
jgi:hypothetical protein